MAQVLIGRARLACRRVVGVDLANTAYALDSTTIDLCLSLFPWAPFRKRKAAVKLHTLLDLGSIPCFVQISHGKTHDVNILDELPIEPGAFYVMDKAYVDFTRLYRFQQQSAFFVTRTKKNLDFRRLKSHTIDKATGLRSDQTIALGGVKTSSLYPGKLRRVHYFNAPTNKRFVFLTNNFALPALTIMELYRHRWRIESFFRWIKQHLRIKTFHGNSANAVRSQVWIAVSTYLLVAILKRELQVERSL